LANSSIQPAGYIAGMSAEQRTSARSWTSQGAWIAAAAALLSAALVLHALLPRYTLTTVGQDGAVVLVFDRWTGQFQRATYGPDGAPKVTEVVRPF
jgi:hypothetical protein